jgi:hypothetical protein
MNRSAMLELRPATGTLTAKLFKNARIGLELSVFLYVMDYGKREFGVQDPNGYYLAFTEPA